MTYDLLEVEGNYRAEEHRKLTECLTQLKEVDVRINELVMTIDDMYNDGEINYNVYCLLIGSLNEMKAMEQKSYG